MVSHPSKKTLVATGILAVFLLAGVGTVVAFERDERPERKDLDARRDASDRHGPLKERMPHRFRDAPAFNLTLEGTATSKLNETYRITIDGEGRAKDRDRNGTVVAIHGFVRLDVQLLADNGSVVKEGKLYGRFVLRMNETGDWHWKLVAVGPHRGDLRMPLGLRGDATPTDGGFDLAGKGRALVKLPDEKDGRTRLALDVEGAIVRA